ncbi:MAG: hypothetical protein Q4E00_00120 [Actinomyces bowdenii]|nr:hypothetical protein [Actinomyces bowdenii]
MSTNRAPDRAPLPQGPVGRILLALGIAAVATLIAIGVTTRSPEMAAMGFFAVANAVAIVIASSASRTRQAEEAVNEVEEEDPFLPPALSAQELGAAQAQALLVRAERLGASTRSRASVVPSLFLLALGCLCSMLIVALHLVALADERLVWLPLSVSMPWLATLLIAFGAFHRSAKAGFSTRWLQVMAIWGVLWLLVMLGMTMLWRGELWFSLAAIGAITVVTTWGAWREARQ